MFIYLREHEILIPRANGYDADFTFYCSEHEEKRAHLGEQQPYSRTTGDINLYDCSGDARANANDSQRHFRYSRVCATVFE